MLKHEDHLQTPSHPAAQVRVSPEELAAAITALQIRKEGQPGTIAIGDAVDELGLDVTAEEVLAEVQARRQVKPKKMQSRFWDRVVLALGLVGIALWVSFFVMPTYPFKDASTISTNVTTAASVPKVVQAETLDKVGNEQQVYVDEHGLQQLVVGEKPDRVQVYPDYKSLRWGLIKHGGENYIQGYTRSSLPVVLASQQISIDNCEDRSQPYPTLKVTLPVKGLDNPDFSSFDQSGWTEMTFVDVDRVRADSHLEDVFPDHFTQ